MVRPQAPVIFHEGGPRMPPDEWVSMGWERIPEAFAQFNTAVLAFRMNERVEQVLRVAAEISDEILPLGFFDQAALRRALWLVPDLQMYTLPPAWQCRTAKTCAVEVSNHVTRDLDSQWQGSSMHSERAAFAPCIIIHAHGLQHTARGS